MNQNIFCKPCKKKNNKLWVLQHKRTLFDEFVGDDVDIFILKMVFSIMNIALGVFVVYYCWDSFGEKYYHPDLKTQNLFTGHYWPLRPEECSYDIYIIKAWNAYLYIGGDTYSRIKYYIGDPHMYHKGWKINKIFYIYNFLIFSYLTLWFYCWFWLAKQLYRCFPTYLKNFIFYTFINVLGLLLLTSLSLFWQHYVNFFFVTPFDDDKLFLFFPVVFELLKSDLLNTPLPEPFWIWEFVSSYYPVDRLGGFFFAPYLGFLFFFYHFAFLIIYANWLLARLENFFENLHKTNHLTYKLAYSIIIVDLIIPHLFLKAYIDGYSLLDFFFLLWPILFTFNFHRLTLFSKIVYTFLNFLNILYYFDASISLILRDGSLFPLFDTNSYTTSVVYFPITLFVLWFFKFLRRAYLILNDDIKV